MDFRIELRDRSFNILDLLEKEANGISWDYSRIGGCGGFKFSLPRRYCDEKHISGDFNVRIYMRTGPGTYALWYQGLIENKIPNIRGNDESIDVSGHGYEAQLDRIYVDDDYSSQEVSVIVKDILDTYITPNTDITYDAGDIVATGFTADTLKFNTDAKSAMQTLADITGTREWGVDKDRKFFFKARSAAAGFYFPLSKNIRNFSEDYDFKGIVNRVIIQGGDVSGTPYTKTYNDTASQLKYGIRTKVIQNSAITTDAVSAQYASAIFAEYNDVLRKATCELINYESRVEATIPIPLFRMKSTGYRYGEAKYGTFLYSGEIDRQVNRINYAISNDKALTVKLELGYLRPSLAEKLAQLEYQLDQQRSASL